MAKNWIMIKRGLSEDPDHRKAIGIKIWLFIHIIDRADWDSGIVLEWRDKQEADGMGIPWRTLQEQRQQLESLGYITCEQGRDYQKIVIHEWVNPRNYSGGVMNSRKEGTVISVPLDSEGTGKGTGKGSRKPRIPTIEDQESGSQVSGNGVGKPRRASPDKPASPFREIQRAYEEACGYPVNWQNGQSVAAKWLSDNDFTAEDVKGCYQALKVDPFWRDKPIHLSSIVKQIGHWRHSQTDPNAGKSAMQIGLEMAIEKARQNGIV